MLLALAFTVAVGADEFARTLTWDAESKEQETKPGDVEAQISFTATNGSTSEIVVNDIHPSCGCTLVSMPDKPWRLAPGASGTIVAKIDLVGKTGTLIKSLTVNSSAGEKSLIFKVRIPDPVQATSAVPDRRASVRRVVNRLTAGGDRQAVFKNDCATCHVQPSVGKMGEELFATSCGICHTAAHRASMVPELVGLPNGGNRDYWHLWIAQGKEGSLMPAFSQSAGGPLTEAQIDSLIDYLLSSHAAHSASPAEPHTQAKTAAKQLPGG
jgi:mono/diheme cytochrome c family protein